MARTNGHGNPKWTREEVMLALSLYFEVGRKILPKTDRQVIELSMLLANLPFHQGPARKENFRNPDGVAFKLQNLHYLDTGDGLGNTSRIDREVWQTYREIPNQVIAFAKQIKRATTIVRTATFPFDFEADDEFFEGRTLSEMHRRIERSASLRKRFFNLQEAFRYTRMRTL
ncbi:hypothetical protein ACFPT7_16025 [Acidicapsa dinghuensis]|uniref:Uncharacterized protein n=1 Tax=Acidicapsa dinghuensis TaxID=2218256 RepID=A0ABW1EHQ8_9BACT|nr:hypothetical protein [Acidicapsa dinghuensis]